MDIRNWNPGLVGIYNWLFDDDEYGYAFFMFWFVKLGFEKDGDGNSFLSGWNRFGFEAKKMKKGIFQPEKEDKSLDGEWQREGGSSGDGDGKSGCRPEIMKIIVGGLFDINAPQIGQAHDKFMSNTNVPNGQNGQIVTTLKVWWAGQMERIEVE